MKKVLKYLFFLSLPLMATFGILYYYNTMPIPGAYETNPVAYPSIDKEELKDKLSKYSKEELFDMYKAGLEATKWQGVLSKANETVFSDVIKDFNDFYIGERYPYDESRDRETKSSYFYHSHRPKEHGHFHIYYCNKQVLGKYNPIATWKNKNPNTHLVAISMHPNGDPIGFFVPNHWITRDNWYHYEDMKEMISNFGINHCYPSWPTNQWINQMLKLFRPQVEEVLKKRDQFIENSAIPIAKLIKNRRYDVISSIPISIPDQMSVIEKLLEED